VEQRSTYAEYLAFEEVSEQRHEFVDGLVRPIADSSPEHARLSAAAGAELGKALALAGRPCAVFGCSLRIRIDATNRTTYADVVVICGPEIHAEIDRNAITNPTMIVEVLSPSTEASDRGEKWRHYQHLASLREYVLVSQGSPYIEVFRREGDEWVLRTVTSGQLLELPSQGVQIPVDAIYADPRRS
jgi:Uma2 family endonuclease